MISSLNHHINVLKLRVHSRYMRYLHEGKVDPVEQGDDDSWCRPIVYRTRWFDLFSADDRKEAMRGLWGVFGYLMRENDDNLGDIDMVDV